MRKPEAIVHGTTSGYLKHRRRGQEACRECKTAQRNYYREYRLNGTKKNK